MQSTVVSDGEIADLIAYWRARRPPYMALFETDLLAVDIAAQRIALGFVVDRRWGHTLGLQGGIVAGMLDSAMAQCAIVCSRFTLSPPTLELKVSYLAPAPPGTFRAVGELLHRGKSTAFARGELFAGNGTLVATATATARLLPRDPAAAL